MENETDRAIQNGVRKLLISRLVGCLAIAFMIAFASIKVAVELKRYLWP